MFGHTCFMHFINPTQKRLNIASHLSLHGFF